MRKVNKTAVVAHKSALVQYDSWHQVSHFLLTGVKGRRQACVFRRITKQPVQQMKNKSIIVLCFFINNFSVITPTLISISPRWGLGSIIPISMVVPFSITMVPRPSISMMVSSTSTIITVTIACIIPPTAAPRGRVTSYVVIFRGRSPTRICHRRGSIVGLQSWQGGRRGWGQNLLGLMMWIIFAHVA